MKPSILLVGVAVLALAAGAANAQSNGNPNNGNNGNDGSNGNAGGGNPNNGNNGNGGSNGNAGGGNPNNGNNGNGGSNGNAGGGNPNNGNNGNGGSNGNAGGGNPNNGNNGNGGSNGNAGGGNPNNGNNGNGGSNGNAGGGNPNNGNNGNGGSNGNAGGGTDGPSAPDLPIFNITVVGNGGDNGTAEGSDGATFTLKGAVSTDCAYYSGNSTSQTIDFGTIGIYASDNTGPAAAFDMTAAANVTIDSNLAGCNTSNTVTLSKADIRGLVNNSSAGYDTNVFQANLPFSVTASYTAGAVGVAGAGSAKSLVLDAVSNSVSAQHGAWKSAMALNVNIPVPSKSLLAGAYQGDLTVNIAAF